MKFEPPKSSGIVIDIGQTAMVVANKGNVFSFALERSEGGRLTPLCRERLAADLRGFLGGKGRGLRTAFCAIGARGVSLRRIALPAASKEEMQRVLRLQIESEFPLPPDELAWGSQLIGPPKASSNGGPPRQEVLVAAVKKTLVEEYSAIFTDCGLVPQFTLAAFARVELCSPPASGPWALLDIGPSQSELVVFDGTLPASIRFLAWDGEMITRAIQEKLAIGRDEAERLKKTIHRPGAEATSESRAALEAVKNALAQVASLMKPPSAGSKLYLSGETARDPEIAALLASALGGAVNCESLEENRAGEMTSAIAGLMRAQAKSGESKLLILDGGRSQSVSPPVLAAWKWAVAAAALIFVALAFPSAEAIVMKPILERKLAALEADRGRLATIDQELDFLKFLKQNQPPYLDVIYLIARSSPRGTTLESLTMGRRQQIALRLKMANAAQITRFRSKLIDSGWFANVIVEEQAASPDRRFSVRMTADLKPAEARKPISAETKKEEEEPDYGPQPEPMMMIPPPQPFTPPPSVRPPAAVPAPAPPAGAPDTPPPQRVRRPRPMPPPDQ